jgi:hypothetical protein
MIKPISPAQIVEIKKKYIPDGVFEVFNDAITIAYEDGLSIVYRDDIVDTLTERFGMERSEIIKNGWLNVEEAYRDSGWQVNYDQAMAGEEYFKAYFKFSKRN